MNRQLLRFTFFLLMCLILPLAATTQKMYWTDKESNKIQRANLDGSNIEDLVIIEDTRLSSIALDVPMPEVEDWAKLSFPVIAPVHLGMTFVLDLTINSVDCLNPFQSSKSLCSSCINSRRI